MLFFYKLRSLYFVASRVGRKNTLHSIQGLTLIELLVVIVMLGILAAISSSTFINVTARAKEAEAKTNVGAMLKAQQAYYSEQGNFANNLTDLGLGIATQTQHYRYRSHQGGTINSDQDGKRIDVLAISIAMPLTDLRGFMGKTWLDVSSDPTVKNVACEGDIGATYFMDNKTYCN
ncbi:MAG: type IV pilin-like G/H family protein [Cyanobacteria bacterium P01_F01_bin.150]